MQNYFLILKTKCMKDFINENRLVYKVLIRFSRANQQTTHAEPYILHSVPFSNY